MTKTELRAWIKARSLTQAQAATLLGLTRGALVRQLSAHGTGATATVGDQTEIICQLRDTLADVMEDFDRTIEQHERASG